MYHWAVQDQEYYFTFDNCVPWRNKKLLTGVFVLWQPQRNRTVCQRGFLLDIHRVKLMWNMATRGRWQGSWGWIQQTQYTKWNISYYLQTLSTFSVHHCLVTTYETQIFLFPGFALCVLASPLLLYYLLFIYYFRLRSKLY